MKDITQLLAEKAETLRATNKRNAKLVGEVLAEKISLEGKLAKIVALEETHKRVVAPIKKNNGTADNHTESFQESADKGDVGRDALIEAVMKALPELCPTKEAAARFASDRPLNREGEELMKAVRGGK